MLWNQAFPSHQNLDIWANNLPNFVLDILSLKCDVAACDGT